MGTADQGANTVEPPRGMFPARMDDKGRLKVPNDFIPYLNSLPEKAFFVTSLDRRIAQIYPMSIWRETEKFLTSFRDNPRAARNVGFNANDLGANAEMDPQGRILFATNLRRELALENRQVYLYAYKGRIQVLSESIYEEQKRQATESAQADAELLEHAGMP